jgi:hypothetical protein
MMSFAFSISSEDEQKRYLTQTLFRELFWLDELGVLMKFNCAPVNRLAQGRWSESGILKCDASEFAAWLTETKRLLKEHVSETPRIHELWLVEKPGWMRGTSGYFTIGEQKYRVSPFWDTLVVSPLSPEHAARDLKNVPYPLPDGSNLPLKEDSQRSSRERPLYIAQAEDVERLFMGTPLYLQHNYFANYFDKELREIEEVVAYCFANQQPIICNMY